MISRQSLVWLLGLVLLAAVAPPAASAATVEVSGDTLEIGGGDDRDLLQLRRADEHFRVQARRGGELSTTSPACQADANDVVMCRAAGIALIDVSTGDGNDRFVVARDFPASGERTDCRGNALGTPLEVAMGGGRNYAELSAGPDVVVGGEKRDVLLGCQGDDRIRGGGGADRLSGDQGNDSIRGSSGNDWLIGCLYDPDDANYPIFERGDDDLRGGPDGDFLFGCPGSDTYRGGKGRDALNTRDKKPEQGSCGGDLDLAFSDASDRLRSCERVTSCTTSHFPTYPCSRRFSARRS